MRRPEWWARRDLMRFGGTLGAAMSLGAARPLRAIGPERGGRRRESAARPGVPLVSGPDPAVIIDGANVRVLALRALDAAKTAGADYADVHLTRSLSQGMTVTDMGRPGGSIGDAGQFGESEVFGVGVRVRVGGAWGFAGSPYWHPEEVVALAKEAVVEARANAQGTLPAPEWAPIPVAQGHWATPIKVDPFVVTIEEKLDYMRAWQALASRYRRCSAGWSLGTSFGREERAVATSEGAYFTQTLYGSGSEFGFSRGDWVGSEWRYGGATARGLEPQAAGWELFTEADLPGQMPRLYEEADPRLHIPPPVKPGEVGRYDVVFDARSAGALLEQTLGVATQLDRALGYEANAGGTSYLGPDPLALLGSYQAASPLVTVTANRSMPRGVGTVKWDDEGVEPEDFTLVKDGVLMDYQTTRDLAHFLAPWYQQQGKPVRSHGCAWSDTGLFITMQHTPNLVLEPGKENVGFDELVASTKKGIAVLDASVLTDFQAKTGEGVGRVVREITNGKLGAELKGIELMFSSPVLWKNVVALGGPQSAVQYATNSGKGQPPQAGVYSVRAVPLKIKDVDFIDPARKA